MLIDPNQWSKDGTVAINGYVPSPDGKYLAWGQAEAGSDWVTWRVMEVEGGKILGDEIRWIKFSNPVWTKDSNGMFYARFPEPDSKAAFQGLNTHKKVYYHALGAPQSADTLVYYDSDHPDWSYHPGVTDDARYLIITVSVGTDSRTRRTTT